MKIVLKLSFSTTRKTWGHGHQLIWRRKLKITSKPVSTSDSNDDNCNHFRNIDDIPFVFEKLQVENKIESFKMLCLASS